MSENFPQGTSSDQSDQLPDEKNVGVYLEDMHAAERRITEVKNDPNRTDEEVAEAAKALQEAAGRGLDGSDLIQGTPEEIVHAEIDKPSAENKELLENVVIDPQQSNNRPTE